MPDIWTHLQSRTRASGGGPLVTFVDGGRSERTELSSTSLENAAAKIANALRDAFDLEAGAVVGLYLPVHWQRAAWCGGVWTAGGIVALDADPATVDLAVAGPDEAAALMGVAPGDVAVVSLHPLGLPATGRLPPGAEDVTLTVRQQPDAYLFERPTPVMAALRVGERLLSQEDVLMEAGRRAADWGLTEGGRLLADDSLDLLDGWLAALAVPLVARGSVVLTRGPYSAAELAGRERVTARAEAG